MHTENVFFCVFVCIFFCLISINFNHMIQGYFSGIDLIHKSHNTLVPYPTIYHSEQKFAHFCSELLDMELVHRGVYATYGGNHLITSVTMKHPR